MKTWHDRAKEIIHSLCKQSFLQVNTYKDYSPKDDSFLGVKLYKKHRPYSVPQDALDLLDCLNRNDEHEAKAIFHSRYAIQKL